MIFADGKTHKADFIVPVLIRNQARLRGYRSRRPRTLKSKNQAEELLSLCP